MAATQLKPVTRFLVQKPGEQVDEDARIALGVLRDRGWNIQNIGLEVSVTVTADRPIPELADVNSGMAHALEASRLIVAKLQRDLDRQRGHEWLLAAAVAAVCAGIAPAGHDGWLWGIVALCGATALVIRAASRIQKGAA